jgi:hypothetical protein
MAYDDLTDKEKIGLLHLRIATIEEFLCSVFDGFHSDVVDRIESKGAVKKVVDEMKNLRNDYPKPRERKK